MKTGDVDKRMDYEEKKYKVQSAGSVENSFNCIDECGVYNSEKPWWRPNLLKDCTAMQESEKCKLKFVDKKKKRKKRKDGQERIVGGEESSYAMPWMVYILIKSVYDFNIQQQCGGSLINTQFVLTAAHCFCAGLLKCSKNIEELAEGIGIGKDPIRVLSDKKEISKHVELILGLTFGGGANMVPHEAKIDNKKYLKFSGQKIFIHPLLGTSEDFQLTPDQALVKMDKKVESFHAHIRPICLATPDVEEKPLCPDNSKDGCAIVAGWGLRLSNDDDARYAPCRTNFAGQSPHKIAFCTTEWTVKGKKVSNCTKEDIPAKALTKACKWLKKELAFQHRLNSKNPTLDSFVKKFDSPVELHYKDDKLYYCGRTKFDSDERNDGLLKNGWCATKLDEDKKIESYGFCNSACHDARQGFMFAKLNILTDDECATLTKYLIEKDSDNDNNFKSEYEICTGKKHKFPKESISLKWKRKDKSVLKKEKAKAKAMDLPKSSKPSKYTFKVVGKRNTSLGVADDYPYDWFIGGVDSCQGDSGGPLWRNIKDSTGNIRATQIGTLSRASGCGDFNSPALFGSVKKSFQWIKEVMEQEMKDGKYCPKKQAYNR